MPNERRGERSATFGGFGALEGGGISIYDQIPRQQLKAMVDFNRYQEAPRSQPQSINTQHPNLSLPTLQNATLNEGLLEVDIAHKVAA